MKARLSRAVALAVAVAITLSLPTTSIGARDARLADAEDQRLADILHAQELYEKVLREGVAGSNSGPYMAPLPGTAGPSYLWGGLDVIEVIRRHDKSIVKDFGGTVFISRDRGDVDGKPTWDLGEPSISLPVATFPRSRDERLALFKTEDNRALFEQMTKEGSLVIMFGLNCAWGIISGPVTNKPEGSHWAQPGLASINVERFVDGKKTVTVLSVNLYSRGDDWNAIENPWQFAIQAFDEVIATPRPWGRERTEMPVLKVNNF